MRDLRFALRLLAKTPGTTAVVVAVLALAIAANTVVFGVVDARLLRPLPYAEPERLVQLWEVDTSRGGDGSTLSPLDFLDWQAESRGFDSMALYGYADVALAAEGGAERLRGVRVSGDFFRVLGVEALRGRTLGPADEEAGGGAAVLSHATWEQRFAADPDIVGRRLVLDGEIATVVGVMPESFRFPTAATELWLTPAYERAGLERGQHFLFGVGRLADGTSLAAARADLDAVAADLARRHPGTNADSGALVVPLAEELVGDVRGEVLLLWGGVGLVLLLACANLASLLLARTAARRRELAVRRALGGSRRHLATQLLTESAVLAALGGGAGVLLAAWTVRWLASGHGPRALHADGLALDPRVLAFSLGVTLLTAILCGLAPAWRAGRAAAADDLRDAGHRVSDGRRSRALPALLVTFQVATAVVVLTVAGLLLQSFLRLQRVEVGFDPTSVVTLQVSLPRTGGPDGATRARLFQRLVERFAAAPGVEAVGGVNDLPFSGSRTQSSFDVEGQIAGPGEPTPHADYRTVLGDYHRTLGLEVVAGEGLPSSPRPDAPAVAVVNRLLAERYLGAGEPADAVGRRLVLRGRQVQVVGVVENLRHDGFDAAPAPEIYVPAAQGAPPPWLFLVARSPLAPDDLAATLRPVTAEILPGVPLYGVGTLRDRMRRSVARERSNSLILTAFAGAALLLAALGIWGTMAYGVARRRREIAIRLALGGRRGTVLRPILLGGMAPALAGIAAGLLLAVPAARAVESLLFGVEPLEPAVFLAVPAGLAAVAALATWLPARRAVAVDPAVTLRDA